MKLATRLCLFFLTALALVLAGFSAALYLLARAHLERQAAERLEAALDTLAAAVEVEEDALEWEPRERRLTLGQDAAEEQPRWEVLDGAEKVLGRSPNLGASALPSGSSWLSGRRQLRSERWSERADLPEPVRARRYEELVLTAAVSRAPAAAALRSLALALTGLSGVVWLTAAILGCALSRRALAPLNQMAQAARATSAADAEPRLPVSATGDELEDLGHAFNDLLSRLRQSFERQRRFTGDASHQLRTPLTAMLGQVEVALRRDRPPEEYRKLLTRVHVQAGHLHRIVEALLFLARADAEATLASLEVIDLAEWVPSQLARWSDHARAADLRLDLADGAFLVHAQPLLLAQLLDNLLDNALKYSPAGTPVTVALTGVALSVEDAGNGIAPDDLSHLFEPFYRSASARRLGLGGVGLGLATARRIAAAFGGTLTVESAPGRGSRFTLRLRRGEGLTSAAPEVQ